MKDVGEENGWLPEDSFKNIIFFSAGLKADLLLIYLWSSWSLSCCGDVGIALL